MLEFWAKMTSPKLKELAREDSVVVFPVGSIEQHGLHLPVGTDTRIVEEVVMGGARKVEDEVDILILPALWVGYSPHHMDFAGSLTLTTDTYIRIITDICQSVMHHGFKKIVIINGHGGNINHLRVAAAKVGEKSDGYVVVVSYFDLISNELLRITREKTIGHAGEAETSLQMYLSPESIDEVELSRSFEVHANDVIMPPAYLFEHFSRNTRTGHFGNPQWGSAELGEALYKASVEQVAALLLTVHKWSDR